MWGRRRNAWSSSPVLWVQARASRPPPARQRRRLSAQALTDHASAKSYNRCVKTWDAILVGAGIVGLSLGLELRKRGARVYILDRGQPGREASSAAAGMLTGGDPHTLPPLRPLADASLALYPEFVHEVEDEAHQRVDFRAEGSLLIPAEAGCGTLLSSEQTA